MFESSKSAIEFSFGAVISTAGATFPRCSLMQPAPPLAPSQSFPAPPFPGLSNDWLQSIDQNLQSTKQPGKLSSRDVPDNLNICRAYRQLA